MQVPVARIAYADRVVNSHPPSSGQPVIGRSGSRSLGRGREFAGTRASPRCHAEVTLEVSVRWGDELVELAHLEPGAPIVVAGVVIAGRAGQIGLVDYTVQEIPCPARTLPYARGSWALVPYLAAALALHVGLWRLATEHAAPIARTARAATATTRPTRIGHPAEARAAPPDAVADDHARDTKAAGKARAMKLPAGGRAATHDHVAVQNTGEEPQLAKAELIAQARRAGVLGSTRVLDEAVQTLAGADRLTSAFDQVTATGGATSGTFGLERNGSGPGGGGLDWGTIGTGDTGAFSSGAGLGHGWGGGVAPQQVTWDRHWSEQTYSYSPLGSRQHHGVVVAVCPDRDRCHVVGALDPTIVRRYVRRNAVMLGYCYEKELLANPLLPAGSVALDFTIRGDGTVADVSVAGISVAVSACVAEVLAKLELPAIGVTQVAYVVVYRRPTP